MCLSPSDADHSDSRRGVGRTESPVGEPEGWSSPDKTGDDKVSNDDSGSDRDDDDEEVDDDARRKKKKTKNDDDDTAGAAPVKQPRKGKSYDYATKLNYLFR